MSHPGYLLFALMYSQINDTIQRGATKLPNSTNSTASFQYNSMVRLVRPGRTGRSQSSDPKLHQTPPIITDLVPARETGSGHLEATFQGKKLYTISLLYP